MTDRIRKSAPIQLTSLNIEEIPLPAAIVASGHQQQVDHQTEETTPGPHSSNSETHDIIELEPSTSSQPDILDDDGFEYPENNFQGWLVFYNTSFPMSAQPPYHGSSQSIPV
ncbi:unnamed protein product [Ambrosiozyma monospora]|uniref:Unnamed protein product n=1 Tax=Ambrosiozyma monospora TaxID=43982 RepID=A0ACB5SU82_AMBMO|nr:unnamed protein product [Ambrosiozyma monospora]